MQPDPWLAVRTALVRTVEGIVAVVGAVALMIIVGVAIDAAAHRSEERGRCQVGECP